jgi:RHS repeat-associated protein
VDGERKKLTPRYNRAGALEGVTLGTDDYVKHIAYNARGQRLLVLYGNGVMTRHVYDPQTFRLARLRTERSRLTADEPAGALTMTGVGLPLQDFLYRYDLAGNITSIDERVPNSGVTNSPRGRDRLLREFDYDPIYRLISATGRSCKDIGVPRELDDDPRCGFFSGGSPNATQDNAPELTELYTETYRYDPAGNMLELAYQAGSGGWTRVFGMGGLPADQWPGAPNNRLTSLTNGPSNHGYGFDANGNLIRQNTERHHIWDHADRMIGYSVQPGSGPASVDARYLYGSDGMRVKKWVRNQQGRVNITVYVGNAFEHHSETDAAGFRMKDTLHVMDNLSRIALLRVGAPLDLRDASPPFQYCLGDHLGSSHVVVGGNMADADGFMNREEYFPYGETSFGSFSSKRYRYSGKEFDEESGWHYFGRRYYSAAFASWVSADPVGPQKHLNCYQAFLNNSLRYSDALGLSEASQPKLTGDWTQGVDIEGFASERNWKNLAGDVAPKEKAYTEYKQHGTTEAYVLSEIEGGTFKGGLITKGAPNNPGALMDVEGFIRPERSAQVGAWIKRGWTPVDFELVIDEVETKKSLLAGENFSDTRIGKHMRDVFRPHNYGVDWSSVVVKVTPGGDVNVSGKFTYDSGKPVAAVSRDFGKKGASRGLRGRMPGFALGAAAGLLQDTPVSLTENGGVTYAFEDPLYGVHTADAMAREDDYFFGNGPKPQWMDTDQESPGYAVGLGVMVGAAVGGPAGAVIGGLLMANVYMYQAYRD